MLKSYYLTIAYKLFPEQSAFYKPPAPVEKKGYKNMIKLPDLRNIQNIFINPGKGREIGEFLLRYPLFFFNRQ